jgi:polyhydroxyalkanoate synthesis regulator phasin
MIDLIKKAVFTGAGIVALTKDKIEEIGQDFVEKGKLSEQEGKKFIDELIKRSDESKEAIRRQIDDRIKDAMQKVDIARSSEMEELKAQIKELQEALREKEQKENS